MSTAEAIFSRNPSNPILTPADWPVPVNAVFNPGATLGEGGETVLLCRVEDRRGLSHLWVARSPNGSTDWTVDSEAILSPDLEGDFDAWGYEDPRVVWLDELGAWVVTCTAYGPAGPAVYLFTTNDFTKIEHQGLIIPPEDKNAALFSERVNGHWLLLHRPITVLTASTAGIWLSRSADLEGWRTSRRVMSHRNGAWWDATRIGVGPPPLLTEHGWLILYHGVKTMVSGPIYRVGAALLDRERPDHVLHRSPDWLMTAEAPYERVGDANNVVFPCGLIHDNSTAELRLYYGAADSVIGMATANLDDLLQYLLTCPAERRGRSSR